MLEIPESFPQRKRHREENAEHQRNHLPARNNNTLLSRCATRCLFSHVLSPAASTAVTHVTLLGASLSQPSSSHRRPN
ncbi:unnamed protein product [Boreogadus saida]